MIIRALEECGLNAWPALQTLAYDGWLLRLADGYTRWANSVQPLYGSTLNPLTKIRHCEAVYRARGQDSVFKLTPAAVPGDLNGLLAAQGYRQEALTSVQTRALTGIELPADAAVTTADEPTAAWMEDVCDLSGVAERHQRAMARMLGSIVPSACFAALRQGDETVAVGLAVAEREYVGLFDIITAAHARRQGHARRLVQHLLRWGRAAGAHAAYLQVMRDNTPALRLYEQLGFHEAYPYWYRVKPQ